MGRSNTQNIKSCSAPKITVLMSVYNGEKYLREAIDSILAQTFMDFEFLIIDDGSIDGTATILRSFDDLRIKIVTNKSNLGLTKSLNNGLMLARGEYIARMDADDVSLPTRLEKQVSYLNNNPDVAIVGSAIQTINNRGEVMNILIQKSYPLYKDFLKDNQMIHGSILIRKAIMQSYGGYNELFINCQDYALWLQLSKGNKFHNIQEILYKLRIHDCAVTVKDEKSIFYHILAVRIAESKISKNEIEIIKKCGIEYIKKIFTKDEWIYYYYSLSGRYRLNGNFFGARSAYWKIFFLKPFDLHNIINLIQIYTGKKGIDMTEKIYIIIVNSKNRIKL